jgi:hypothetical protein
MHAMDAYKRANGRMFPTCSEILEVILSLGYRKSNLASHETEAANPAVAEPIVTESEGVETIVESTDE